MRYVSSRRLLSSEIDENYKDLKITSILEFNQKLKDLRYLSHCRYTHLPCDQTTFVVSREAEQVENMGNSLFLLNTAKLHNIEGLLLMKYYFEQINIPLEFRVKVWYRI